MNPFFTDWKTKYQAIPFDLIKLEHFMPAIEEYLKQAREKAKALKDSSETPNFENTILALEQVSEDLERPIKFIIICFPQNQTMSLKRLQKRLDRCFLNSVVR